MGIRSTLSEDQFKKQSEEIQALYKKDGETYVLDVDNVQNHPKVKNLQESYEKVKRGLKQLKDAAHGRELDEDTIKDDSVRDAVVKLRSRFSWIPEDLDEDGLKALKNAAEGKGGQVTDEQIAEMREKITAKLEKQYGEKHKREVEPLQTENGSLKARLNRVVIDNGLSSAMDAANIDPKHKEAVGYLLKGSGKIRVETDDDGERAVVESDMGPVGIKDFVAEYAGSEAGKIYVAKSTGPSPAGGSNTNGSGGKTMTRSTFDGLSAVDKAKTMSEGTQLTEG